MIHLHSDKLEDDSTESKQSDICTFTHGGFLQEFEEFDEEGNETAFKEVVRLFKEPDTRRYLPKMANLKINVFQDNEEDDEETPY